MKSRRIAIVLVYGLLIWMAGCQTTLIDQDQLEAMNQKYADTVFVVREDIYPHFVGESARDYPPLFQKGDRVRIRVESSMEWMRVKAYSASRSREQATGKTILYLFENNLPEDDEMPARYLENRIQTILETSEK